MWFIKTEFCDELKMLLCNKIEKFKFDAKYQEFLIDNAKEP